MNLQNYTPYKYSIMKKYFWNLIFLVSLVGCTEAKTTLNQTQLVQPAQPKEIYILGFYPSFHDDLHLQFDVYSDDSIKLTLIQNPRIFVYDSITYPDKESAQFVWFGDATKITPLIKRNFIIEYFLTNEEYNEYKVNLEKVKENVIKNQGKDRRYGTDGMGIYFGYANNSDTIEDHFWSEDVDGAFVKILEILEKNPSGIVVKTCEKIKQYIDKTQFKILSDDPLYIKVFNTPCCPCQSKIANFVKTLQNADEIFLDITHYGYYKNEEDLSCIEQEFKKKYKHIRWVMNSDEMERFDNLIYRKTNKPNNRTNKKNK